MSIALAFLAAMFWGASDFFGGVAVKKAHFVPVSFMRQLFEIVLFGLLLLAIPSTFHLSEFLVCVGLGLIVGISLPIFYNALANGRMALVAPVAGLVSASLPILVGVLSGERPT